MARCGIISFHTFWLACGLTCHMARCISIGIEEECHMARCKPIATGMIWCVLNRSTIWLGVHLSILEWYDVNWIGVPYGPVYIYRYWYDLVGVWKECHMARWYWYDLVGIESEYHVARCKWIGTCMVSWELNWSSIWLGVVFYRYKKLTCGPEGCCRSRARCLSVISSIRKSALLFWW